MTSIQIKRQGFKTVTVIYWFLLVYIIAALVWWFIALDNQNRAMYTLRKNELVPTSNDYSNKMFKIEDERKRKTSQYIGEGVTFFIVIILGAVVVYRVIRKQFQLSQQQQNFTMAVTHELKTPIAVVNLSLETLLKRTLSNEQQQKLIAQSLQEVKRLNTLTNNILATARMEQKREWFDNERIDVGSLLVEVTQDYKNLYPGRNIVIKNEEDVFINGEQIMVQLLASNLLDNALKYSPANTPVYLYVKKENDKGILIVADEGFGINDIEKKKVFNKFYRTGNEITRSTKGTGLGLYLCQRIVKNHQGKIKVEDNIPQGSIFTVTIPLAV